MNEDASRSSPRDPAGVLADLPVHLWPPLVRALRRAVERLPTGDLPAELRPYARFKPESLMRGRAHKAVVGALAHDADLRDEVGEALDDPGLLEAAATSDPTRLAEQHGPERAAAGLVVRGRWDALAVLAAEAAGRIAMRDRAAAEEDARQAAQRAEAARARMAADLAATREERDAARRRAEQAEQALRRARSDGVRVQQELDALRDELTDLQSRMRKERSRWERARDRLKARVEAAEEAAKVDAERVREVLGTLDDLGATLRSALEPAVKDDPGTPRPGGPPETGSLPRGVPPAGPGRPCVLPPGVDPASPAAVVSLLQVPGVQVILDGYNVSMDVRGRGGMDLQEQRLWLVQHAASVHARYRCRLTLVFDGSDPAAGRMRPRRGVNILFTTGEEIADERIIGIVEELGPGAPVLVVSSDQEVRASCTALGADVVGSGLYLRATG